VLEGRVAFVTGASSGIGQATARLLASSGVRVAAVARRLDRLESLRKEIQDSGGHASAIRVDVADRASVEAAVSRVSLEYGPIDVLVNNAGIMPLSPIRALEVGDWERMIDVNLKGLLYCIAAVLPSMLERGQGHIVNVGSVAGRRPFPGGAVYSATKFAVRCVSEGLRLELSPQHNIRVTDIEPGVVATELTDHIRDEEIRTRFRETWAPRTPLTADDIARAVLFAVEQPPHVNVNELLVRPTEQET
jgi:NADP-dependent 3-hydroxy acid dehydrogenase YdfG